VGTVYTIPHWPKDLTGVSSVIILMNNGAAR